MSNLDLSDLEEDLHEEDFDFEIGEQTPSKTFCKMKLKPGLWVLGGVIVLVMLGSFFIKDMPTAGQIQESWGEPEKTYKLLNQSIGGFPVGLPPATQQTLVPSRVEGLTPLPYGARWRINPPHPERGPCHNCHPFSQVAAPVITSQKSVTVRRLGMTVVDSVKGPYITQVFGNSWAQKGKLRHGDVIVKFDHRRVGSVAKFRKLVTAATPEKRALMTILRDGKKMKMNVMVGEGEMEGVTIPTKKAATPNPSGQPAALWGPYTNGGQPVGRVGFGLDSGGYISCPQCGFRMIHQIGVPAYTVRCPNCGTTMVREEILQQVQGRTGQPVGVQGTNPWYPPR